MLQFYCIPLDSTGFNLCMSSDMISFIGNRYVLWGLSYCACVVKHTSCCGDIGSYLKILTGSSDRIKEIQVVYHVIHSSPKGMATLLIGNHHGIVVQLFANLALETFFQGLKGGSFTACAHDDILVRECLQVYKKCHSICLRNKFIQLINLNFYRIVSIRARVV